MRNKIIFTLSILGILAGIVSAFILGQQRPAQPPVFKPVSSPYDTAIYANGMIESEQQAGENINIFPEVSGSVTQVLVREGQRVVVGKSNMGTDESLILVVAAKVTE